MILPVMRSLQKRQPQWQLTLMALTTGEQVARKEGFECLTYRDFSHWYDKDELSRLSDDLLESTNHPTVSQDESRAYLGINFIELERLVGEVEAKRRYAEHGRWAFQPVAFMRRVLAELQPDMVVTTNSPRSEAAVIDAAAALKIPSLCMVDLFSPPGDPFFGRPRYADMLTTIDELGRRNLIAGGIPAEQIHITGNPAFDALASPRINDQAMLERERLGWQGLKVILWAGNLDGYIPAHGSFPQDGSESDLSHLGNTVERLLRNFVAQKNGVALLIRYHPNQAHYFPIGATQERFYRSDALTRAAHVDIKMADIVVVNGSTIGLEAAIAGKSVLSMDNSPWRHIFPLSDYGISRGVSSFNHLLPMIESAIDSPHPNYFANQKGESASKITELIVKCLYKPELD